ncbi:DUF6301 family protein [Streptomyces clavuligerus]|uniref:Uncharacterized protein n=1 Tax=Streptomyces clavuligerus TaxID=1901 RepID=B5H1I2_STRCL|nr:DUF6301 family protein [Streptomyces clavuligerus]ANW22496.1 hypothetical protein BB341_29745 [Streptomyces clavuligerus]AXU16997.1 hypothetical protein D1794_30295 [Streptomyces clavuligerus]AXU17395.1 hypothetical protein D1794_32880 [Streptomyces clavuligerus]EDY52428.1 hypothetical protein SSCG_05456 [Streptomyces clavuligerus]EFG04616.1 Hypothetical protein SCLAV_p1130 [Streptomyces clavuligerus]
MRRLTPEQGVEAARRLDSHDWSWTIQELGPALEAFGLVPLDPLDGPSLRTDNPELPGVHGFVVNLQDEGLVLEVAVNLTDVDPAKSEESLASFESAFMDYLVALTGAFGPPDGAESSKVVFWDRGDEVLMLRNLNICVDLARLSKNSVRIREGG